MQYNITYREKNKGIQFIISYKDSLGKWKQKSKQGFKTKREAKIAADEALSKLKVNSNLSSEFEGITFGEFSKEYLKHSQLYKELETIESTKTVISRFSGLNDIALSKITTLHIQKIVDELTSQFLNPNTIKYYLKKLTAVFNAAKNQYNIINFIPTRNVKCPKSKETNKKALSDNEIKMLLDNFNNSKYYLVIFLAINTGMRLGEILGLTWNDVDFKNNTIKVNKQWKQLKNGEWGFGSLKTQNSNRIIPISKSTAKELIKYKDVVNIDNRVIGYKNKNSLIINLNGTLKRHGFTVTIHEFRHTYATKLIANGLDFKTVAKILGHDVQQTIKTYSHVNNDMLDKAKDLIENIF